jgi:hypothetical protein
VSDGDFAVTHAHGRDVLISHRGVDIADYVYVPDTPLAEARKPYLHPIRTLSGAIVSAFRPWDHRWHKGLQMTWSHVSGQNFWGGKTYRHGDGYIWLDNVGRMRHDAFADVDAAPDAVTLRETLSWLTAAGEHWVSEERTLRFHGADRERGVWQLDFSTVLRNVRAEPLRLGSPTTHGRPDAGYTGLFWRGPRAWTGGEIIAAGGRGGEEMMGEQAPWLAVAGRHDEVDGGGTVVFFAGTSSAAVPIRWFVRSGPFASINPSPAFREEINLEPGATLRLRHRMAVADRAWDRAELEDFAKEHAL